MIVLDTHTALWWTQQPELLGSGAKEAIRKADRILIPAIVFWETALLVRKKRFALKHGRLIAEWAAAFLSIPRVREVPLTHQLAIQADGLEMHPDPADRFIAATALKYKAPLVTKDNLLQTLTWLNTIW
ncbi:MAG TPA: type II toxin-antitoxin system VapC family toxin [Spirochaetales bacterium]|nr:type II toxin-antitoxin system VapC family toxin [Spirochaetales bacterium]